MYDHGLSSGFSTLVRKLWLLFYMKLINNCDRCVNRNNPTSWTTLSSSKARILEFVWAPNINHGVKLSAMKFAQRVILVQTRGISDPRVCIL